MRIFIFCICVHFAISLEKQLPRLIKAAHLELSSITDCKDEKIIPPDGLQCQLKLVGNGPTKALDATVTLPFDLDDSIMYRCSFKKWINDAWVPIPFSLSGSVCKHGPKFLPGIWEKLSKALNVSPQCPIKQGTYVLKGFTAEPSDVRIPAAFAGKYLAATTILKDNKPLLCKEGEVNIISG